MAFNSKLVLAGFTAGSLLVYILCVKLEGPLSWSIEPLRHFHGFSQEPNSSSRDSEEPLDRKNSSERWSRPSPASTLHPQLPSATALQGNTSAHTPAPTSETQTAAEPQAPARSTSRSAAVGGTRGSTRGPTLKPQRSTEPPFIGDAYMSEDVPAQTNCTDGVRSRVAQTEFGGRFLRHIPVLQWANHVSRDQYLRLTQYPGAHGWEGVDYNTLVEALSVLNSSANRQMLDDWSSRSNGSECTRCAVVGNGGILKESGKGQEIDSHHYVFRTNGAVIKGFEQDVGSRTTHYTFSTNTLMNSMGSYAGLGFTGPPLSQETRYVFLPEHDRDYLLVKAAATHTAVERGRERAKDPTKYFGEDVTAEKLKMYHPDFTRYLRNRFLRSGTLKTKYKSIYRPTTGAVMLLAALHSCDQVSAYGFMTPDYKNYSDHYYDRNYHPVGFYVNHDMRMEMTLWQQLHQAGLMRLYMHK
ncbi:alpha-N-acetylgalactosaminide alpha-2,6-sialyltransferase 2 [Hippoglossus stenolepis]|uniref:alpha-N-acetylgalactosaminide alpha-2,6-sialyltransferase 2 n=1 Tax=Hippoglossus stenolepis TaxID=195615 RepID=UPI00159C0E38|nr:alpha-N-acetylgalactosaminide alpha-2,6-sialyltransferase 2 [Hippoglossus stenolepis]XP_035001801.1 alpha-N-acetylgalactosaminide alpha-2,6-sialyltransferase 2 [Hippoglossus stenolepis]XP_035001802.1 alpha-N-acetylgalactosaminide alpha-2,6-sialyltransferase 2 [Hippoglossus stenolepis]